MFENPSSPHADFDETWRRLESLVEEVAQWAKQADSVAEYYGLLLQRAVTELRVAGGAIWILDAAKQPQRIDLIGSPAFDALTSRVAHRDEVRQAFQIDHDPDEPRGARKALRGQTAAGDQIPCTSARPADRNLTLCVAPVVVDGVVVAVLEVARDANNALPIHENAEHVLAALADVSVDFHRAAELRDLRKLAAAWEATHEFSDCVHGDLRLDETCYAIANEGRRFVGADRLSILVARGTSLRLHATSGVESVDRRAPEAILLRKLSTAVARWGEAVWTQVPGEHPPQIQELLEEYHDVSGVRCLAIIPLAPPPRPGKSRLPGVLVVEKFSSDKFDVVARDRLEICRRQAATALANALEVHSLPLLGLSRGIRHAGRLFGFQSLTHFSLAIVAALLLGGGFVAAFCFVQVEFTITARGRLQPVEQQDIFATSDGVVESTSVRHGDEVDAGEVLVQLRNTELDYETERLLGDLSTTRAKLQAIQAARVVDGRNRQQVGLHNAEIERLKQMLTGMERQQAILKRQREDLSVRASVAGHVMSWEADKSLVSRPVRQGQRLMTIARLDGPWQLELDVPDEEIGHVLQARRTSGDEAIAVRFVLLTDPATSQQGTVADVGLATVVTGDHQPTVHVLVDVDADELNSPRPGAGVVAHFHCGRRSIGYVWFRRFWEELRMHMLI